MVSYSFRSWIGWIWDATRILSAPFIQTSEWTSSPRPMSHFTFFFNLKIISMSKVLIVSVRTYFILLDCTECIRCLLCFIIPTFDCNVGLLWHLPICFIIHLIIFFLSFFILIFHHYNFSICHYLNIWEGIHFLNHNKYMFWF